MDVFSGIKNSITDVASVNGGHVTVDADAVQTGATVIMPYPLSVHNRKVFIGSFASGNWQAWTGRQVAADFGTFSSPIVLCNSSTVGIAYDALITFGHQRHQDLPIDNGWPPVVIGIDDGYLNDLRQRTLTHDAILDLVQSAGNAPMRCGSVGIGRGLGALGGKGGVGDASRVTKLDDEDAVVGVFIAANGGHIVDGDHKVRASSLAPSIVVIIATNLPLLPAELSTLAEVCLRGLDEMIDMDANTRQLSLAFSTGNTIDNAFEEEFHLKPLRQYQRSQLGDLFFAGAEAARAAFRRALTEAEPISGRKGRRLEKVDLFRFDRRR